VAVTKTLIKAVPYVPDGDLRSIVDSWDFTMAFQNGDPGDSDYLYKEYSAHCYNGIILHRLGESKAAADFTRADLESLCLVDEWTANFHALSAEGKIKPDTSFTLPS